jgi:hypothetical protein
MISEGPIRLSDCSIRLSDVLNGPIRLSDVLNGPIRVLDAPIVLSAEPIRLLEYHIILSEYTWPSTLVYLVPYQATGSQIITL